MDPSCLIRNGQMVKRSDRPPWSDLSLTKECEGGGQVMVLVMVVLATTV